MATVAATEFNRNPSRVKQLAANEPVVITEHDRPTFVLLSYAEYERLSGATRDLVPWLEMEHDVDLEIEETGFAFEPEDLA